MVEKQISIRDVNKEVFNDFKALAVKKHMKLGQALTMVMMEFLNEDKEISKKSLLTMKTSNWGKGTENTSEEVDKILYGG